MVLALAWPWEWALLDQPSLHVSMHYESKISEIVSREIEVRDDSWHEPSNRRGR